MKAISYHRYGDDDVLVLDNIDRPVPGPGQVLLKVAGTSFNPVDATIRAGYLSQVFPLELPHIPGIDVAGTVAELGAGGGGWHDGDAVMAFLPMTGQGAAAEYALASAQTLAPAPAAVDLADAAALPAAGLTAWQALFEHAEVQAGQQVLVNGAGGAVGGYAVQLAAQAGAHVTATASARSAERVRGYGAERVIDYTVTPVTEAAQGPFDVVLNFAVTSPEETTSLVGLVRDGGVLVSTTTPAQEDAARGVRTVSVFVRSDAAQLTELSRRVDAGSLHIHVAEHASLADLPGVHARSAAGTLPGKTVIVP